MDKNKYVYELRDLTRLLVRNLGILDKSEASCCGTTIGQCHAIIEIGTAQEISLNELADILKLDNSTISRTVNNLVDQQLVVREIDPQDRRYIKMKLTDRGWTVYESIEKNMNMYYACLLKDIPEEKHAQVIESLALVVEAMKNNKCC
ncbi:MAG: transcriptional regulator, MarR family [Clostridia bacterium]|jgi:DNA-binding MarR family transcriptional regulator|nr:transcriptional regulator, MarR family [Clostridia bacterium]